MSELAERSISWDEVKAMIAAITEQNRETARLFAELRAQSAETDRRMQETDRRMQETDRRMQETDRRMQETDRQMAETDRRLKETNRMIKELGKKIGGLGDKFGYFTEGLALPSMERILIDRFGMEHISPRHKVKRQQSEQEYDVLAWANGEINLAIVVEVKSRVRREAIAQLLRQIEELPQMLPELAGKARIGMLAGVDWDAGVAEEAQATGFYTATIHDQVFELTVPEGFAPKRW